MCRRKWRWHSYDALEFVFFVSYLYCVVQDMLGFHGVVFLSNTLVLEGFAHA